MDKRTDQEDIVGTTMQAKLVGTNMAISDARYLVMGEGRYVGDINLPRMLHVAFLRSPHAHARIVSVDVSEALKVPGVEVVLTGNDILGKIAPFISQPQRYSSGKVMTQELLARELVRFVGEPICAVAAVDLYRAEDAAERIVVKYEPLPVVFDPREGLAAESTLLHPQMGTNALIHRSFAAGDLDGAFARAAHVVKHSVRSTRKTALPMEGRGCVAAYRHDQTTLTVWMNHQLPYVARYLLSTHLGIRENDIRLIAPNSGGGYGQKASFYPEEFIVTYLSWTLKRPVKWIEDRLQNLKGSSHARDQFIDLETAVTKDGRLLALKARVVVDIGAYSIYPWTGGMEPLQTAGLMTGPYRIASHAYETFGVATNKTPVGPYRGVGRPTASLAIEQLIDAVARKLCMDPADVRAINLVRRDEMPYRSANKLVHDRTSYYECFELALAKADYPKLRNKQQAAPRQGKLIGIGLCSYAELTGLGTKTPVAPGTMMRPGRDSVTLRLEPTGVLSVLACMPSQGQRIVTALTQVTADAMGFNPEDIKIYDNDSAVAPYAFGTFASRTSVLGAGAIIIAARELKQRILNCAAYVMKKNTAESLQIVDSVVVGVDGQRLTLEALCQICFFEAQKIPSEINIGFDVTQFYDPSFGSFANGTHVAVVEIDTRTGRVHIVKYLAAEDCGRLINPAAVRGQVEGAVVQGIGEALFEELVYDRSGQLITGTLMDYTIPTIGDVPDIELHHMETSSNQEGGFKGVGEGPQIGGLAAVAGAVVDALAQVGATLSEFPASPERILRSLKEASAKGVSC